MDAAPESYPLTQEQVDGFHRDGWTVLPDFLQEEQLQSLERDYMRLLRREVPVRGRDYCDMAGDYQRPIEEFELLNVMLPRTYLPSLQGNAYERRAAGVSSDGAAWVFDLEGVPGLPTRIEAKGVDLKARPVDLAETNVGLQPGERRTAVLRLDR